MAIEEKQAAIKEEVKRMRQLPLNSSYAAHRLRLLDKIQQLLSLQVGVVRLFVYNQLW
ncbi:hypothetical protein PHJA_002768200 [Phtheirospermum japonicum]|uniref:Uncharacterized protein n=1 Tax=Phtheirospermum japonicum TaxID=374723 RepID=A0A830DJX9_9LAMI|nr:hypothetical protein PHJA_002768200 [Phtheirospermum japonicum]